MHSTMFHFYRPCILLACIISKKNINAKSDELLLKNGPSGVAVDDSSEPSFRFVCGTSEPTRDQIEESNKEFFGWQDGKATDGVGFASADDTGCEQSSNCVNWDDEVITIPTYINIIHDGEKGAKYIFERNSTYIIQQMKVMNNAFAGGESFYPLFENGPRSYPEFEQEDIDVGIQFCLMGTTATDNKRWYNNYEQYKNDFKNTLHRGGMETLNVYFTNIRGEEEDEVVAGEATFPTDTNPGNRSLDGISINNLCFPERIGTECGEGDTLVHEIGHWLNLLHSFSGGCEGPVGDYMDHAPQSDSYESKTRYESNELLYGCPVGLDDCSDNGRKSPIHNYMSYRSDNCLNEFTPGQIVHMQSAWEIYRHKVDYSKYWAVADDGYSCCRANGVPCTEDSDCCNGQCETNKDEMTCAGEYGSWY